jgi:hypothetical protein
MTIIEPPPAPPKKETIAVRLEVAVLDQLKRYAAFLGTGNLSHVIAKSLEKVFKTDSDYKAWLKLHPDFVIRKKARRNERTSQHEDAAFSGASAPHSLVNAAERRVTPGTSDGAL